MFSWISVVRSDFIENIRNYLKDNVKSAELQSDGTLVRGKTSARKARMRSQEVLYQKAVSAVRQAEQSRRTVFEPHRAPDAQ